MTNLNGVISFNDFVYKEKEKDVSIPQANLSVSRSETADVYKLASSLGDIELIGKIDFNTVLNDFVYELAKIVPSINISSSLKNTQTINNFTYEITTKKLDDLFSIFLPELYIADGAKLKGGFDSKNENFQLVINASEVMYDSIIIKGIDINQNMTSNGFFADYKFAKLIIDDSLSFNKVDFISKGTQGVLSSSLIWDPNGKNFSKLDWKTKVKNANDILFTVEPSFFSINDIRWDIFTNSTIALVNSDIDFNNLLLRRKNQEINIDGLFSNNANEKLIIELKKLDLSEISQLLKLDVQLAGFYNGNVSINNSSSNVEFSVLADISKLFVNEQELGDIHFTSDYDSESQSIYASGNLTYRALPTMDFSASYFMKRDRNNLEMDLNFNNTDLHFLNGFIDPTSVS